MQIKGVERCKQLGLPETRVGMKKSPVGVSQTEAAVLFLSALKQLCGGRKEPGGVAGGIHLGWVVSLHA